MRFSLDIFLKDNVIKLSSVISFLLFITGVGMVIFTYQSLPSYIPFFNSFPWGSERLAPSFYVLFLPVAFLGILIINYLLAMVIYDKYTILARILSINVFLFLIFGVLAYAQILFLVF